MRTEPGQIVADLQRDTTVALAPPAATATPSNRSTILVVDSVDYNRQYLKGMLKAGPYRILEAETPEEGLRLLSDVAADLIIADLMMPGIGGLEFCRCVKGNRKTRFIPVLIMTNVQGIENEVAGLESGADEFLIRPLRPDRSPHESAGDVEKQESDRLPGGGGDDSVLAGPNSGSA